VKALDTSAIVAVIGAGTMGTGIAQIAAGAGHRVLLYDAFEGAAGTGKERIAAGLRQLVSRGKLDSVKAASLLDRIALAPTLADLAPAALVIEAIVEDVAVKRKLFADLEAVVGERCLLATNTSSISITAIARGLSDPGRCVGMHFFNPATTMKLVEVVSGVATRADVEATIHATALAWRKVPVRARSTPGFIVNRVARSFYGEALRLHEEGLADPATIDALMTGAGGFRMGPFDLMDLIGNDVNYAVSVSVYNAFFQEPRFRPSLIQRELVESGRLGRKTGQASMTIGRARRSPPRRPSSRRLARSRCRRMTSA
jgi:3-hydroxybutyryl-CoA dehydrogenase